MKTPKGLEFRLLNVICELEDDNDRAKKCAEIALEEIRKAFEAGRNYEYESDFGPIPRRSPNLEEYLLEQNLIEKK